MVSARERKSAFTNWSSGMLTVGTSLSIILLLNNATNKMLLETYPCATFFWQTDHVCMQARSHNEANEAVASPKISKKKFASDEKFIIFFSPSINLIRVVWC